MSEFGTNDASHELIPLYMYALTLPTKLLYPQGSPQGLPQGSSQGLPQGAGGPPEGIMPPVSRWSRPVGLGGILNYIIHPSI
jgi:hypothetical protein